MGLALWSVKTTPLGLALWSVKTTPWGAISLGLKKLNKPEKPNKQDCWIARPHPASSF